MIIQGIDSNSISRALLVDSSGRVIISALDLTTTGGKIFIDASGRVITLPTGWIGGASQKNPLLIGYSAQVARSVSDLNLPAGTSTTSDSAVPAGEIWVITHIGVTVVSATANILQAQLTVGANAYVVLDQRPPASGVWYPSFGYWVMAAGDALSVNVFNATLNDDVYLRALGFRVDIDQ